MNFVFGLTWISVECVLLNYNSVLGLGVSARYFEDLIMIWGPFSVFLM